MKYHIDIDGTICSVDASLPSEKRYPAAVPLQERIDRVNRLFDEGHHISYWTARGATSGLDFEEVTRQQLVRWGCKFHELMMKKPHYDIYVDDKSYNVDALWPLSPSRASKKTATERVPKGWGHEIIIVNNDLYCGKILHFKKGGKFSMHFHLKKKESWYVSSGSFLFRWINTATADIVEEKLVVGDTITNEIGEPHQIICVEEGDIFEVSTHHLDSDSYRVAKGDSQTAPCCSE
jgi:mannose-6-phosphate isomerase-like protein (cupin superfamily)